jgi:cell division protein ZapB
MEEQLAALEQRIQQTAELCHRLRTENNELRLQLVQLSGENKRLSDKMSSAKERLEALLEQIPE